MHKTERFTFKLDAEERRRLEWLARRLQRTQSDALRWLIRRAAAVPAGLDDDLIRIDGDEEVPFSDVGEEMF